MNAFQRMHLRRFGAGLLVLIIAVLSLLPLLSFADEELPAAGYREQMIRVYLTRMALTDRIDLTLISPYVLTNQHKEQIYLKEGWWFAPCKIHFRFLLLKTIKVQSSIDWKENRPCESGWRIWDLRSNPQSPACSLQLLVIQGRIRSGTL